jgi:hypothetical protein
LGKSFFFLVSLRYKPNPGRRKSPIVRKTQISPSAQGFPHTKSNKENPGGGKKRSGKDWGQTVPEKNTNRLEEKIAIDWSCFYFLARFVLSNLLSFATFLSFLRFLSQKKSSNARETVEKEVS